MRSLRYSLPAVLACALAAVGMTGSARAATVAATPVLSLSALGGPAATPGDQLASSLTPGTTLSLTTVASGGVGLFCQQSVWSGQLLANPSLPGPAVIRVMPPLTIASCTDNSPTVTGVTGVAVSGLPDMLQVTGTGSFPLQLLPGASPLQIAVTLTTTTAPSVVCTFQSPGPLLGNTALGSTPWRFVNQPFKLISGPLPACGTAPTGFLTAAYSPVIDTTAGGANVFVN
jgi:hypothetical protein